MRIFPRQREKYLTNTNQTKTMTTTTETNRIKLPNQSDVQGYLSEEEIEWIIEQSKQLRKGHKRDLGSSWFTVRIDGQSIRINKTHELKSLLGTCYIYRKNVEIFRNYMKSITIKLDECY